MPETTLEVVTRVEGEEVVMTVLLEEDEVVVGVLEVVELEEEEVDVEVGVEATGDGNRNAKDCKF